jgi:lysophospholipase L1-like esterase
MKNILLILLTATSVVAVGLLLRQHAVLDEMSRDRQDWPGLHVFKASNRESSGKAAVIFGDSIALLHPALPDSINRGIAGQTTAQMLLRFRQDVVELHPRVVVLIGGVNDLLRPESTASADATHENITAMCDIARANAIKIILTTVTPADNSQLRNPEKLHELNGWLSTFAAEKKIKLLDLNSIFADGARWKPGYSLDGLHPNGAAYAIIAKMTNDAVSEAIRESGGDR